MKMICPKCGKTMTLGKISGFYGGYYPTNASYPFWAEKGYFTRVTFPNSKDAEKKGVGFSIMPKPEKINIAYTNLPDAYACKECRLVLLDCNE